MKKLLYMLFSSFLVLFAYPLLAEEQDEVSVFSNEAQVQKAETLAEISQEQGQKEALETQKNIENAEVELSIAEEKLEELQQNPEATPQEIIDAQLAVDSVLTQLDAQTEKLANISSSTVEDIAQMRDEGLGWGDIAHELNIHPGNLGLGHGKKDARQREVDSYASLRGNSKNSENSNYFGLKGKSSLSSEKGNKGGNSFGRGNSSKGANSSNSMGNGNGKGGGKK